MGIIGLEKVGGNNTNQNTGYSDSVYINDSLGELNNNETETYVFETAEERRISNNLASGMNGNRIQREGSLILMCLTTFIFSAFMIFLIVGVAYIFLSSIKGSFQIFPYKSNYTAEEFNGYLRRAFMILFGLVSGLSIISMIIINKNVKNRFNDYYLSKFKVFIYDVFVIIQNIILYISEMWIMFQVVNGLHSDFVTYQTNGTILGSVNIETIEVFKYIIVIIMTIFIVLNSFSSIDIIHQKNRFVFENQI